jgi:S-formylglutathione hydrolase FrmB
MARAQGARRQSSSRIFLVLTSIVIALVPQSSKDLALGADTGKIDKISIPSPEKDFPIRTVYVWTPPGNYLRSSLPVVYLLHGWPGSPASMIAGVTKPLIAAFAKGAKPFIAVFPDGNAKTHIDSEWADSSDKNAMIETWLTTNVIQSVESDRIRDKSERAIAGFSMGGYGAGIIGIHHPELYTQIATMAGYFIIDDLTGTFATTDQIKSQNPSNYLNQANKFRWYVSVGRNDFTHPIYGQATYWTNKLKSVKASFVLHQPPGYHDFNFVGNEIGLIANWFLWPKAPVTQVSASATPIPTPNSTSTPNSNPSMNPTPSATPSPATT